MIRTEQRSEDEGFTLIEVLIAMLLLAILSLALLPSLIGILKTSVRNVSVATATQFVNNNLVQAQTAGTTCTGIQNFGSAIIGPLTDNRGVTFSTTRSVGPCPATYPGTVKVSVTVMSSNSLQAVATGSTLVIVRSAS
ncbi:prepilin-type N-terminal cleavage/methylation domain-containing protein [Leifsonia sp. EB34]|uniref:prepilin-type N-terminal cleavage/methylation domain-containing protein n=1 Tax=Leifsonia sp. EB34 TaxID=3156303 RepID=UPI003517A68D